VKAAAFDPGVEWLNERGPEHTAYAYVPAERSIDGKARATWLTEEEYQELLKAGATAIGPCPPA
jgi:hypothetical protein